MLSFGLIPSELLSRISSAPRWALVVLTQIIGTKRVISHVAKMVQAFSSLCPPSTRPYTSSVRPRLNGGTFQ